MVFGTDMVNTEEKFGLLLKSRLTSNQYARALAVFNNYDVSLSLDIAHMVLFAWGVDRIENVLTELERSEIRDKLKKWDINSTQVMLTDILRKCCENAAEL
jgi:hypothetical protein